jgi:anhydro-N-acetylmuramic acid kinase
MQENHICSRDVDYIASHGQTVYHIPEKTEEYERSTLQIGEPAEIALRTGCMVISNFRTMDMAAGGEGAPLVPYADYILYRSAEKTRVLLNIGGISNVTYLPRNAEEKDVFAFDTGPGNMMIDEAMRHFYHKEYDEDGNTAERGNVNSSLLKELMDMSYVRMNPPKSTGRELYGKQKVEELLQKYAEVSAEDAVCTFTEYTAASIAENVKLFLCPKGIPAEIIAAGGGAHNRVLLERLQEDLPEARVMKQEDMGFSSDAKEAIAFVILGNETLHRHYSNMISATGASKRVILGNITPKPMLK